jgi:hypothetical protein
MQTPSKLLHQGLVALALILGVAIDSAYGETVYTGDAIGGARVISQLDVNDLEPGKKHRFFFQGIAMATGQNWYVPVMVAKGVNPGKKVLLGAGVHGDELSPTDVVQRAFAELDSTRMSGTVLAVLDMSRPSKEFIQRRRLLMTLRLTFISHVFARRNTKSLQSQPPSMRRSTGIREPWSSFQVGTEVIHDRS